MQGRELIKLADRSLRGASIGAHSLETEEGVVFAQRTRWHYICPSGHEFFLDFAVEAEAPTKWECRECAIEAVIATEDFDDDIRQIKPQRTHWDMLRERRTITELEEILEERLEQYRSGDIDFDDE